MARSFVSLKLTTSRRKWKLCEEVGLFSDFLTSAQRAREEFHWRTLRQRLKRNLQSRKKLPNTTAALARASVMVLVERVKSRLGTPVAATRYADLHSGLEFNT